MGFVVEGFNDESKVLSVINNASCVVTKGTKIDNRVKKSVNELIDTCDKVFLLTEPDEAGNRLTTMLLKFYPFLVRIQLDREECLCYRNHKVKVGVEHCTDEYLLKVLSNYF
jgi:ribonuclease M5